METHLAGNGGLPRIPGYRLWHMCRSGARRASGGVAVLVHERFDAGPVSLWEPDGQRGSSPYHLWLRFGGGRHHTRPMFLAACYLPPYRSQYGLKSPQELDDYVSLVGDQVAAARATPGGADVLFAGDTNGHMGCLPDWEDRSALLAAALPDAVEEVLMPCAAEGPAWVPPPRTSGCRMAPCPQGKAILQLCQTTGLLVGNGRVQGDLQGSPTCFTGTGSLIDVFLLSPSLLPQATGLHVLPAVPEYQGHRPIELWLAAPAAAELAAADAATCAEPESDSFGPPPSFATPLRITPERLSSFANELGQPAAAAQLQHLASTACSDPLQAATQLHTLLYSTAAAVFPAATAGPRQRAGSTSHQLRRGHQPWFDAECEAARQQIRRQMKASLVSGQPSHLAKQALRALSSKFARLRQRKAAVWRRQRGTALLQLQRTDPRRFFRQWKRRNPDSPIDAATWLRHHVNIQLKRTFKPSRARPPPSSPSTAAAAAPQATPPPDPELDADITAAEVATAINKISAGSACLGPLSAALIKAGRGALAPVLASLFTAVLRSGCYPPDWALGAITSIHKKGDVTDPNNYRGITVGHVLAKLYATVINARLTTWLETRGLRAKGQAGFRQGYRTVDNCFILRALAERARARGVKLYCCAVDLEKAFDSLDREELWAALRRSGVGGAMLRAIQAMYANVSVCVKTADGLSGCFQSVLGVKQGCPLSPLLFGIFMDDLETQLVAELGDAAALPTLAGRRMPPMLFADDAFLIATTAAGLQAQLHFLQDYCDAKKLTVNAAKTQVMILRPGGGSSGRLAAGEAFTYAGRPLTVVSSTKYLGLTFSQLSKARGFASCADVLAKAGRQAMFAMRRRAWELGASSVQQQCWLFDVFVQPVLCYGCEVWGVDLLLGTDCSSVERVHRWFCRRIQGLPTQVSSAVALAELGRQPLRLFWVRQLVRFWNRLLAGMGEPDRPLAWAFEDNLALLREGADLAAGSPCWCRRWLQFLQSAPTDSGTLVWLTQLDEGAVVERAAAAALRQSLTPTPPKPPAQRQQPASAAAAAPATATNKFANYLALIRPNLPLGTPAPHLHEVSNPTHLAALCRFRCSCHDLRIERERYLPPEIKAPRHHRTCLCCASTAIEDEIHMVFHCPIYERLRFQYADLFSPPPPSLASFLSQNQTRVASFIHDCLVLRRQHA